MLNSTNFDFSVLKAISVIKFISFWGGSPGLVVTGGDSC